MNLSTSVRPALLLATVVYLLAVFPCLQPVSAKDSWVRVSSKNFVLVGNANEKEIKQVGVRLEQFREIVSRLFAGANFKSSVPTTVIVFKSDKSFRPFKPTPNVAGYFQSGSDVNYITLTTESSGTERKPFNIIFHEYTHLLVNATSINVPTWFNEGLAEYYSTFSIANDQKVVLGRPIAGHVYLLRYRKMLPLRTLFQVDHKSPDYNQGDNQSIFYAQSWALIHYLSHGKNGQRATQVAKFLNLMTTTISVEEAFQSAFSVSFEEMENELWTYIHRNTYSILSKQFDSKVKLDFEMRATPITDAEAQAYLGDLLLHGDRPEAEGYLKRALELDPNLAMVHASLGILRVREGKLDEARKSLERAVAANSQNYLIHYYYAFALSREGIDKGAAVSAYAPEALAKMRAGLNKAIELRPDFLESYSLLAFLNVVSGTQLDESVELLKRVLTVSPGRNDLVLMLAQVFMRKDDYKAARQLLEKLSGNNADAQVRERAQALQAQIVSMEEQMARFRARGNEQSMGSTGRSWLQETVVIENPDPTSLLRESLRKPSAGEMQVQGILSRIDCDAKGIVFIVKLGDRQLMVKTDSFKKMKIVSFAESAGREITCGLRRPENDVVINYVPAADTRTRIDGLVKSIEFVPSDFKLKTEP